MGLLELQQIRENRDKPKEKKVYRIPKKSAKKIAQEKEEALATPKGNSELERWFIERRKELTGKCSHCGGKSCKDDSSWFKASIAHLMPKRLFKSVATHPKNFIELCFWGKSCHTNFDQNIIDIMELNCFDEVIEKFIAMYPDIDQKERRYIPDVLRQYVP